jgi:hypothetical protein
MVAHVKGAVGRDYAAEYAARKLRGAARALTTAQSRGHAPTGASITALKKQGLITSTGSAQDSIFRRVAQAIRTYESQPAGKKSLSKAAAHAGVSPSTVKRHGLRSGRLQRVAVYQRDASGALKPTTHTKGFETYIHGSFPVLTPNGDLHLYLEFDQANMSILGRYWNAVDEARLYGQVKPLRAFQGVVVRDIDGNEYRLLTNIDKIHAVFERLSPQDRRDYDRAFYSRVTVGSAA